jgi:hypothetical protein
MKTLFLILIALGCSKGFSDTPANRVASILISQDFINEQLKLHSKSNLIKDMNIGLDSSNSQIFLRGKVNIPLEEMRAINLDPNLGAFKFQVTIKPEVTKRGHLILDFPLSETFFYPAASKDPVHERIIIPVQLLSVVLASARGYLAALSGDFSGFDRRTDKVKALISSLEHSIAREKNGDAKAELKNQLAAQRLQLEAIPIERTQLQTVSKELEHLMGFTGEKELNLNSDLGARKNALILKINLDQLAPYLKGVEMGGVRIVHDKKDGNGENFLAIDVNSELEGPAPSVAPRAPSDRPPMKVAPFLIMRLNQSLFESEALVDAEKKDMGSKLKNVNFNLRDDGLHVSGSWHTFLFLSIPFDVAVDFVSTGVDVFEVRLGKLDVAGIDFDFMSKFVLDSIRKRLDKTLKKICIFKDIPHGLQVTVDPKALVPAVPDLHLVAVDVRDREFLLKIGRP